MRSTPVLFLLASALTTAAVVTVAGCDKHPPVGPTDVGPMSNAPPSTGAPIHDGHPPVGPTNDHPLVDGGTLDAASGR